MFKKGGIWAYPTDTSFGLGVRADDQEGLERLKTLKKRSGEKYFSLMVRDWEMLCQFADIEEIEIEDSFFFEKPRTAILFPKVQLPKTEFWPTDKVAFRICTIPEIAQNIDYPITATSANISGNAPLYTVDELEEVFGDQIQIYDKIPQIPPVPASEIWDFTHVPCIQVR